MTTREDIQRADVARNRRRTASDLQALCLRRTLSELELSGLRDRLARSDRTRGWLA